jgi:hypothetical protein
MAIAVSASAKVDIAKATISGPGLAEKVRIEASDTRGLWESGIDVAGGLEDARADSVEELGLTPADLGPRYLVTYRFFREDRVRQDLYPYAKGGPVTYTPAGQRVAEGQPWGGVVSAGWYRSSHRFFQYLVDQGLPRRNPVPATTPGEPVSDARQTAPTAQWAELVVVLVALALSLVAKGGSSSGRRRLMQRRP